MVLFAIWLLVRWMLFAGVGLEVGFVFMCLFVYGVLVVLVVLLIGLRFAC